MTQNDALDGWLAEEADSADSANPQRLANGRGYDAALCQHRLAKYRPRLAKKVASWVSIGLGVIMLLPVAGRTTGDNPYEGVSLSVQIILAACYAGMLILPGAYWLWRNRKDSALVREWAESTQEYRDVWESLDPMTKSAFAAPTNELPLLAQRRWWLIFSFMVVLALIGGSLLPPQV